MRAPSFVITNHCYEENDRNSRPVSLIKDDTVRTNPLHLRRRGATPSTVRNPRKDRVPGVSLNMRKRSAKDAQTDDDVAMSSYNSAFLSGLFADIAKASVPSDDEDSQGRSRSNGKTPMNTHMNCPPPSKKSRISMTKSISRCEKSFGNLRMAAAANATSTKVPRKTKTFPSSVMESPVARNDSLSYQLHCVSSSSSNESDAAAQTSDIGKIAFPHLPATVSNSSCSQLASLTRRNSSQLSLESETDPTKECYGWFVTVDDDDYHTPLPAPAQKADPYNSSSSLNALAFSAATAPKGSNQHDAEVEWAKAADTVDDVLGDFF
jgi:hypothetical protein